MLNKNNDSTPATSRSAHDSTNPADFLLNSPPSSEHGAEDPDTLLHSPLPLANRCRRRLNMAIAVAPHHSTTLEPITTDGSAPTTTPFVSHQRNFELALAEIIGFLQDPTGLNCSHVETQAFAEGQEITLKFMKDEQAHHLTFIPAPEENGYRIRTNLAEKTETIMAMKIAARKNGRICLYDVQAKETFQQYCQLMLELNIALELDPKHTEYQKFKNWLADISADIKPQIQDLGQLHAVTPTAPLVSPLPHGLALNTEHSLVPAS